MKALLLTAHGPVVSNTHPSPTVGPGEALIRTRLAGICSTDLALINGYKRGYQGVLGHEFVGEVVDAPDAPAWIGRRVVGEISIGCGHCALCDRGLGKHCRKRTCLGLIDHDGVMAEMLTLPVANLHEVPASVPNEAAVFVEPLAAALQILEQVRIGAQDRVYVVGGGKLGMLVAQVLALTGCDLTVVGRHRRALQMLAQWLGCRTVLDSPATVAELMAEPADVVVEATGSLGGFSAARKLVRPAGTMVLKSTFAGEAPPLDLTSLVVEEVSVVGSRCGPFEAALGLLERGRVQVLPLIDGSYPLDDAFSALEHARQRGVLKILIRP